MSRLNRLAKLERTRQTGKAKRYTCCYYEAEQDKGYDVIGAGETIHFDTLAELEAFEARPDIDLTVLVVSYIDWTKRTRGKYDG